jgi:hypothetical protein
MTPPGRAAGTAVMNLRVQSIGRFRFGIAGTVPDEGDLLRPRIREVNLRSRRPPHSATPCRKRHNRQITANVRAA